MTWNSSLLRQTDNKGQDMKKEMLEYLKSKDKDGFDLWSHPQKDWIKDFLECFFDQYQPERLSEKTYYRNKDGTYPHLEPCIGSDSLNSMET